tara:strand:+ start:26083 stop:27966 length:1884 start_codon:yes stop_codon:yes gene_type:complete
MTTTLNFFPILRMKNEELLKQFISDLQIPECSVQVGTTNSAIGTLTVENYEKVLKQLEGKDVFFLGGVSKEVNKRAGDKDIEKKGHLYLDFDIRHEEPEITDTEICELGAWFGECLNTHNILKQWRYITFTGNGIHVHYFGEPVAVKSIEHWRDGMRFLIKEAKVCTGMSPDDGCVNLARLSRLPGSSNHKNGFCKKVVFLEHQHASIDVCSVEKHGVRNQRSPEKAEKLPDAIPEGKRNTVLTSIAGTLRKRGLDESTILVTLRGINSNKCSPPLPDNELQQIVQSIERYPVGSPNQIAKPVLTQLSEVEAEQISWLWYRRIPKGKIVFFDGDPGLGKSWAAFAIAATVSNGGLLPGETVRPDPSMVLLLTAEDGLGDTIRPRMESMDADLSKIVVLEAVKDEKGQERHLSLVKNLGAVEEALQSGDFSLIIIDPLNAYLGGDVDTYKDADIRTVLAPLSKLAEKYDVAILCIRHLTKAKGGSAIHRGQGSIAYLAAARVGHLVARHPENENLRVIACTKINVEKPPRAIIFEIDDNGDFFWRDEIDISADSLLESGGQGAKDSTLADAKQFLFDLLWDNPLSAKEIFKQAEDAGFSKRTLERAKAELDIISKRDGASWAWMLPNA